MMLDKKIKKGKIVRRVLLSIFALLIIFLTVVFTVNKIKLSKELKMLDEAGYYNPVSVGDYSLNVYKYGNESGKHNIVALSGAGVSDFSIQLTTVTDQFSDDNQIIFVDRAGYGLSDDTKTPQTIGQIVDDYRTALKNSGVEVPYVLVPHSIAGIYATYWVSEYPEEIEGIVFLDGTQLGSDTTFDDVFTSAFLNKMEILSCQLGLYRMVSKSYIIPLTEEHSEEEQKLSYAMNVRTGSNYAISSEVEYMVENCQTAWNTLKTNDVPKVYVCASCGYTSEDEVIEDINWLNEQRVRRGIPVQEIDNSLPPIAVKQAQEMRETVIEPYMEKLGNCELVLLPGDHFIFSQKPDECAHIITDFLNRLDDK